MSVLDGIDLNEMTRLISEGLRVFSELEEEFKTNQGILVTLLNPKFNN